MNCARAFYHDQMTDSIKEELTRQMEISIQHDPGALVHFAHLGSDCDHESLSKLKTALRIGSYLLTTTEQDKMDKTWLVVFQRQSAR